MPGAPSTYAADYASDYFNDEPTQAASQTAISNASSTIATSPSHWTSATRGAPSTFGADYTHEYFNDTHVHSQPATETAKLSVPAGTGIAASRNGVAASPLYRITTLFRSHPNLTESQFYNYWYNNHGPLCVPWALHYKFVEYTQYHTPSHLRQALADGKDGVFKANSPFEACADFYIEDYQDYLDAFKDPYYLEVVSADEDLFVDKGHVERKSEGESQLDVGNVKAISTMGICRSVVRDGKALVDVPESVWNKWEEYQRKSNGVPN